MTDDILAHREERFETIQSFFMGRAKRNLVVTIKANIPGENKNIIEAYLLVRLFKNMLIKSLSPTDTYDDDGPDGPMFVMAFRTGEAHEMKLKMIEIETHHPLGRFIDLDVYRFKEFSVSRVQVEQAPRTCYVCGEDARICSKEKRHPTKELIDYMKHHVFLHIKDVVGLLMDQAIMAELELEDKFGLVTKLTQGSHPDMNYDVMIKAKEAILPYLTLTFEKGFFAKDLTTLLNETRHIGIEAEQQMMRATNGINAYKGLIFVLGIFALATGYTIANTDDIGLTFYHAKVICHNILKDFERPLSTYGYNAYVNYHIFGVRGESHQGFPAVRNTLGIIQGRKITDDLLRRALKDLILMTDDTVLLKRAGSIGNYFRIKDRIKALDMGDMKAVKAFTTYAIKNDLSFGGSADLLIAVVYMKLLQDTLF
ncbi:MAG: triphosphoribosyl-dephospho-CoA synthase [Acholeplasmataceae bacterium]